MIFIWASFFSVRWVIVVGLTVILHELSHMAVCLAAGVRIYDLKALPWGLTAETALMHEPHTQLAVSAAGPMFNFLLLTLCPLIELVFSEDTAELFALANLADALLNLIPALPLDGGIILKSFLCARFGLIRGFSHMIKLTAALGFIIMIFGIHILIVTGSNASYLIAGIFIVYNLKHERELVMCLKKKVLTGEINSKSTVRVLRVESESNAICLIDLISPSYTALFKVYTKDKHIGTVSQAGLIENVLKNTMITVGECIEKF